jgi:hypothetical protein
VIVSEAVREDPGAVGPKVTVMVQWLVAATELPQVLLVTEKSPAFAPVTWVLVIFKLAFPLLVNVRVWLAVDPTGTLVV